MTQALNSPYTTLLYTTSHCPKPGGKAKLSWITNAVLPPDASTMHIQTPLLWHSRWFTEPQFVCQTHGLKLQLGTTFAATPPCEHHNSLVHPSCSPRACRAGRNSKPGQAFSEHKAQPSSPCAAQHHKNPGAWVAHPWPKQGCSSGTAVGGQEKVYLPGVWASEQYPLSHLPQKELTSLFFLIVHYWGSRSALEGHWQKTLT